MRVRIFSSEDDEEERVEPAASIPAWPRFMEFRRLQSQGGNHDANPARGSSFRVIVPLSLAT